MQKPKRVYDGDKIDALARKKGVDKKSIAESAGYAEGSVNTYSRLIHEQLPLGLYELSSIAQRLQEDVTDIVKAEYLDMISSVSLAKFKDANELHKFFLDYETTHNGRVLICNSFPSRIYYANDSSERLNRYNFLNGIKPLNYEYYHLRAVLNFGFSDFSVLTKEEKLGALREFIKTHGKERSAKSRCFIITDGDGFIYSEFAAGCEILADKILLIEAPFYENAIIIIKSSALTKEILEDVNTKSANIISEAETVKMLEILHDCMSRNESLVHFAVKLKSENSPFHEAVSLVVSSNIIKDEIIKKSGKVKRRRD